MKIKAKLFLSFLIVSLVIIASNYMLFYTNTGTQITTGVTGLEQAQIIPAFSILKIPIFLIMSLIIIASATFLVTNSVIKPVKKLRENLFQTSDYENTAIPEDEIGYLTKDICEKIRGDTTDFHEFLDNIDDLIQSVNEKGFFIYVNKKWREILGYSLEEAKKMSFPQIIKKEQLPHCMEVFNELKKGKTVEKVKTIFMSKSGKEIPVEGNINTKIEKGRLVETRGIFRDVSEKTKNKNQLDKIFNLGIERELKMKELKKEIKDLKEKLKNK